MSLNVFNGWVMTGGIFAAVGGHCRALGIALTGESKSQNIFARARQLHFVLMTQVPQNVQDVALRGIRAAPRRSNWTRYTDAEWEMWHAQRRQ